MPVQSLHVFTPRTGSDGAILILILNQTFIIEMTDPCHAYSRRPRHTTKQYGHQSVHLIKIELLHLSKTFLSP